MPRLDTETLDLLLATLREYAAKELQPEFLLELDHKDEFPTKVLKDLYDPESDRDSPALDPRRVWRHRRRRLRHLSRLGGDGRDRPGHRHRRPGDLSGTDPINVGGTPEQKAHWLAKLAENGLLVAYGATEPQAGSDLAALTTRAVPVEEDGQVTGYRISGRKQWISNGGVADVYTILADAPGGPSWFIVERGVEGFTHGKPEDKHGIRASNTAALFLEDVFVPVDRLVGGVEGQGLAQAQAVFGYTRLMVAAFGLGAGWAALTRAIRYSQQRIQGGGPLSEKQGYTHKLIVPNACRLEAARAYIEWTADRIDDGEPTT